MKSFKILSSFVLFLCLTMTLNAQELEIRDGWFYIDGEKFFIKGIGYEQGALPGELPWTRTFDADQLRFDMKRILDGGYNTIRTWANFTEQELEVLKEFDIKIIMGIWVDPTGNFASSSFVSQAKSLVSSVLAYSKNYDNIIGYLIMNEPMPEVIFNAGYDETVDLWTQLRDIIHTAHPGRAVSIANTCNGTYIDPAVFDFSAYNAYIYNPVTINYLHGYKEFVSYLGDLKDPALPLVITEYGLSVSPTGPGNWGYGGNTLQEQTEGDLHMYKSIVDGGATGSCIFNYSDGWWKGTDENVHNDLVEEWFGLVNYTSVDDHQGETRPVWDSVRNYQSAIISQPQSSEFYGTKVPVEIFSNDTVKRIDIMLDEQLVWQSNSPSSYISDTLVIDSVDIKDALLIFNCFDKDDKLIKSEEKIILIHKADITIPSLTIQINEDYWESSKVNVDYTINKGTDFTIGPTLYYIYYPHVGFEYGQKYQVAMPAGDPAAFTKTHTISSTADAFTIGAGFDISYGSFTRRIVNQYTDKRPVSTGGITEQAITGPVLYPNPAKEWFRISELQQNSMKNITCTIYTTTGSIACIMKNPNWQRAIDVSALSPGLYLVKIESAEQGKILVEHLIKR